MNCHSAYLNYIILSNIVYIRNNYKTDRLGIGCLIF